MCHEYDSRDSGYRLDRRWMRGEDHGNPLPIALFILTWSYCSIYSDMEAKPESAEEEKDQRPDSRQAFFFEPQSVVEVQAEHGLNWLMGWLHRSE